MSLIGSESSASAPSKISDSRAVAYDQGINVTGSKNKLSLSRAEDMAYQFAEAGQSTITGTGNSTSFNVLDGGAITGALDLAKAALQIGADSSIASGELAAGYGQQLQTFVADQAADPGDSMTLTKWVIGGALVFGLVLVFRKGRK